MNSMTSRAQLRQSIRTRRKELSSKSQEAASLALKEKLTLHHKIQHAKRLAIYLSNDGELDTMPFIKWCWQQKKSVYLPVVHPFSPGNLLFLNYTAETSLVKNTFGIYEPKLNVTSLCSLSQLDIIFTPLVAFDKTGARLGMGGGFYDRSLAYWQKNQTYPIGLAHDCQLVDSIPTEIWDIPLPEIITPSKCYTFI